MDPGSFDLDPESVRVYALSGGVNKFYSYKPDGGRAVHSALTDTMRSDRYSYYPDSDLVQIAGDYACRYDENGNMTEKGDRYTESGGEITIHKEGRYALYKYDLLNRLVSVSRLNGEGEVEVAASYRYSHRNLRIERTDKAGTVRYVFDLDGNIIEEHRGDELIRYVFRRGKHLAKITPDGTYYYGTDRLGSTTVMFDGEGSVVWRGDVSPFGELVSSEGSIEERVKFTGKDYDEAAGLYYFNARWYDAELGRFTTEDPARDGLNWYVYVRNNPLRFVDPTGLEGEGYNDGEDVEIDPPGWEPTKSPGEGWEWKGKSRSQPGDKEGSWHNPETGESLHPDLDHPEGKKPHWDYKPGRGKKKTRIDPDTGKPLVPDTPMAAQPGDDTLKDAATAGAIAGGAVVTIIVVKKVVGAILLLIPEPVTTGVGAGLLVTP